MKATAIGNMEVEITEDMAKDERRALLTDDERAILLGEREVSDKYYYTVITRVRKKIQKLEADDLKALAEHDTLLDELREGVCEEERD